MRRRNLVGAGATLAVAAASALPAAAQGAQAGGEAGAKGGPKAPLALADWGSFHVGGHTVEITGKPPREVVFSPGGVPAKIDPNGTYMTGAMYVQYMVPAERHGSLPLMLWHGGGLTGVCFETTPDGREGWQHFFLRRGWPVYVSDAVERGRSGFSSPDIFAGEPLFLPISNPWERFRIGDGPGSFARGTVLPGNRFPHERDSYQNFMRQNVPRWTTTDDLILAAYCALLDRVGPSVVLVHSQGGLFGWRAAQERPHLVKALVLCEPAVTGLAEKIPALKDIPQLLVYGDFIDADSRWPTIRANGIAFAEKIRAAGGHVDVVDLPARGIRGNSHMMMMDGNNTEVAAVIQDWLTARGLWT